MTSVEPPQTIARLLAAVYPSFALLAGMKLDLFTQLQDGPLTVEELAERLDVRDEKLQPLLYALVVAGLLVVDDKRFANTTEAQHYLVRGKPAYLGGIQDLAFNNWARMLKTADTIRSGGIPAQIDYHAPSREEMIALFRGLYAGAVADARHLMQHADFSTCASLLDVGGGSGALAITIVAAHPHIKATVLELPSVTAITEEFVVKAGVAGHVSVLAGDAVRDVPPGSYDTIIARHLIQVLSPDDSRALLRNLAAALRPAV